MLVEHESFYLGGIVLSTMGNYIDASSLTLAVSIEARIVMRKKDRWRPNASD